MISNNSSGYTFSLSTYNITSGKHAAETRTHANIHKRLWYNILTTVTGSLVRGENNITERE